MPQNQNKSVPVVMAAAALLAVVLFFYGMDQLLMAWQGLPLNPDMTPAR